MSFSFSALDFFVGGSSVMLCSRSFVLSLVGQLEKSCKKTSLVLRQTFVSLDNLKVKTRPPAHKCLWALDSSQDHKSFLFLLDSFLSAIAVNNSCKIAHASSVNFLTTYSKAFLSLKQ